LERYSKINEPEQKNFDNQRPNIILIVIDSLRYDHVGAQGGQPSLTPNLDRIAEEGLIFEQAISQGPSTRVSMSALMSSTYASMYGGQLLLSENRPVVQELLREAGYQTSAITANLYLSRQFGWSRGFDYYDDCRPAQVYRRKLWLRAANQVIRRVGFPLLWPRSLPASLVFENAEIFLNQATSPFFMWVHLMDTHWPYSIQDFSWDPQRIQKRQVEMKLQPRLITNPPQISRDEHEQLIADYQHAASYADEQVGKFLNLLEYKGILKNSWVFITADHGEEFNEHGHYFHQVSLSDELVHVPLIIKPPQGFPVPTGQVKFQVRLIDLVPTFLNIAQASQPDGLLHGESLLSLISGDAGGKDHPAVIESPGNQLLAYRVDSWKLIWNTDTGEVHLFDLAADPDECLNRAGDEPARVKMMLAILTAHIDRVKISNATAVSRQQDLELDPELVEQLRNLGYID
jgi:arylsulfatase A-like enzyme